MANNELDYTDKYGPKQSDTPLVVEGVEEELKVPESIGTFGLSRQDPRPISQQTTVDPMSMEEIPAYTPPPEVKYRLIESSTFNP